jgi:hypothetical protein
MRLPHKHPKHEREPGPYGPDPRGHEEIHGPHEEVVELIERKFREMNSRLDDIEARLGK